MKESFIDFISDCGDLVSVTKKVLTLAEPESTRTYENISGVAKIVKQQRGNYVLEIFGVFSREELTARFHDRIKGIIVSVAFGWVRVNVDVMNIPNLPKYLSEFEEESARHVATTEQIATEQSKFIYTNKILDKYRKEILNLECSGADKDKLALLHISCNELEAVNLKQLKDFYGYNPDGPEGKDVLENLGIEIEEPWTSVEPGFRSYVKVGSVYEK